MAVRGFLLDASDASHEGIRPGKGRNDNRDLVSALELEPYSIVGWPLPADALARNPPAPYMFVQRSPARLVRVGLYVSGRRKRSRCHPPVIQDFGNMVDPVGFLDNAKS